MADVKYKTGDEIRAAALELNPKFSQFLELGKLAEEYEAIDPAADDATEKRKELGARAQPIYEAARKSYFEEVSPEAIEIIKSINAQPNKFGFNSERDQLLVLGSSINNLLTVADNQIILLPKVAKAHKEKVAAAQADKAAGKTPTTPKAAEPAPPAATETAATPVAAAAPPATQATPAASTPAAAPSPAAPVKSVPENQLSSSQKNNLVKSNSVGTGAQKTTASTTQSATTNTTPLGPGWEKYSAAEIEYMKRNLSLLGLNDRVLYAPLSAAGQKRIDANLSTPTAKANIAKIQTELASKPTKPSTPAIAAPAEEPAFGPNAKNYDFSKMTPEEIAAVGKFGGGGSSSAQQSEDEDWVVRAPRVRPNPLHEYPSYTYGLSLHILTPDTFNKIVDTGEYTPTNVLIASAGKYNKDSTKPFGRVPAFSNDFYFENLRFVTVIGHGEYNRATNAVDISFTLIEPYGLTLFDKLLRAADELGVENYLQVPYMLQIDFYGADSEGNILGALPNMTKNIPIKLLKCSAKASTNGAEYTIVAGPYGHQAYDEGTTTTPITVEVTANTVDSFFKSSNSISFAMQSEVASYDNAREQAAAETADNKPKKDLTYKTDSYADALNAYMEHLATQHYIIPDQYDFKFAKEIGESIIVDGAPAPKDAPMWQGIEDLSRAARAAQSYDTDSVKKSSITTISHGDSIEAVIARVVRNSQYIRKQLAVITKATTAESYKSAIEANKNQPLKWFKIVPTIKIKKFDPQTNTFARIITYYVMPYIIRNALLPDAPQEKAKYPTKIYNYMYTGENNDIIDLNIEFNVTFYTPITAYRDTNSAIAGDGIPYYDTGTMCVPYKPAGRKTIQPTMYKYTSVDQRDVNSIKATSAFEVAAADLERTVLSRFNGDMMKVDLTILGDPQFIKQDDLFYSPKLDKQSGFIVPPAGVVTPNDSLITDKGEIYCQLTIRTPEDIDDETGLMRFEAATSGFSGLFKILRVENVFNKGKFTQKLTLIRQQNQEEEEKPKEDSVEQRSESTDSQTDQSTAATDPPPAEQPPATPEAEDTANKSAAAPATVPNPQPDPGAKDLANVRATGNTQPITSATAPQAVVPNPNASEIKELEKDLTYAQRSLDDQQRNLTSAQDLLAIAQRNLAHAQSTNNQGEITTWQNSIAERTRTLATVQKQYDTAKATVDAVNARLNQLR